MPAKKSKQKVKEKVPIKPPTQTNLRTLISYVETHGNSLKKELVCFPTQNWFTEFGSAIMVGILLSNCATEEDVESLTVNDCAQIISTKSLVNEEMLETLDPEYQEIVQTYYAVPNNKTNKLLVIREDQKESLELILKYRAMLPTNNNPYAFGNKFKGQPKVIKVATALKKFAEKCGAENPELLRIENIQNLTMVCRLLDTSVNRKLFEARLFEKNMPDVMLTVCKISFVLLDIIGFFEGDSVKMFHEHVRITAENFGYLKNEHFENGKVFVGNKQR